VSSLRLVGGRIFVASAAYEKSTRVRPTSVRSTLCGPRSRGCRIENGATRMGVSVRLDWFSACPALKISSPRAAITAIGRSDTRRSWILRVSTGRARVEESKILSTPLQTKNPRASDPRASDLHSAGLGAAGLGLPFGDSCRSSESGRPLGASRRVEISDSIYEWTAIGQSDPRRSWILRVSTGRAHFEEPNTRRLRDL